MSSLIPQSAVNFPTRFRYLLIEFFQGDFIMAIHYTSFGSFGPDMQYYADLNGFVPQRGDDPSDFSWDHHDFSSDYDDHGNGYDGCAEEMWQEFLSVAEDAMDRVYRNLDSKIFYDPRYEDGIYDDFDE
jgi:hypothetical protein